MPLRRRHWGILIHLYVPLAHQGWKIGGDEEYKEVHINKAEEEVSGVPKSTTSTSRPDHQSSLLCLQPQWKAPRTVSKEEERFEAWFHAKYKMGFLGKVSTNLLPGNYFQWLQSCSSVSFLHLIIATHKQPKSKCPLQILPQQSCSQ